MVKECPVCSTSFRPRPYLVNKQICCSVSCAAKFKTGKKRLDRREKVKKKCPICSTEFLVAPCRCLSRICCSMDCAAKNRTAEKSPCWKGGVYLNEQGYRKLVRSGKRLFEHRLILEAKLGRPLKAHEVTHHINGDKLDNRSENLEILTQSEHRKLHAIVDLLKSLPRLKLV